MSPVVRGALLFAVGGLVVVACSGDDDAAPSSTTTTIAPTTSTSTSSTSTTSTSTSAPLTVEEEVIAAYQAAYDAFWAASQNPNDPELRRQLERALTGPVLERSRAILDGYVLAGQRVLPSPEVEHGFNVISVDVDQSSAVLEVCTVNPWILVQDGDGGQVVVDDAVVVLLRSEMMALVEGIWLQEDNQINVDLSEAGECPAS